jgi:hypothetical protein
VWRELADNGLPLTTVARTLVDLSATQQLVRAQGRPTRKLRAALRTRRSSSKVSAVKWVAVPRDAVHSMMGFRTLRFTWRQVAYQPGFVAKAIARALAG